MYTRYGGRFGKVFEGTLPDEDVMLLRLIQLKGGDSILPDGLRDLSATTALVKKAMLTVRVAILGFIFPLIFTLFSVVSLPMYAAPRLREMARDMPPDFYPSSVDKLFSISDFLSGNAWLLCLGFVCFVAGVVASMKRVTGPVRWKLDKYGLVWSIHRDFESIRFISNLSLIIKTRNSKSDSLRESLENLRHGANRWKTDVIRRMLVNLMERGLPTKDIFKVGLFSEEMQFYLEDLIESRGLNNALEYLIPRLEEVVIQKLRFRCLVFMWLMLAISVAVSIYLFILRTVALRELQEALIRFYFN